MFAAKEVSNFRSAVLKQRQYAGNNHRKQQHSSPSFSDHKTAEEILSSLKSNTGYGMRGHLYKRRRFARQYEKQTGAAKIPLHPPEYGHQFEGPLFKLCQPISFKNETIGAIYIVYDIRVSIPIWAFI